jgi:alkylated DNA repair dioxygenase AlkB
MPPVRVMITVTGKYDGSHMIDFREFGINAIYIPDFLSTSMSSTLFDRVVKSGALGRHTYVNRFGVTISPHRLTYAHVPPRERYRYNGRDISYSPNTDFAAIVNDLVNSLGSTDTCVSYPNACIANLYRYNNDDYIAPHTDDEKFLQDGNCSLWPDSTVYTVTLLNSSKPMEYHLANPDHPEVGFSIELRHGSLLIQGKVLHSVPKIYGNSDQARISLTLRNLYDKCVHGPKCTKITCPYNNGPSNYVYYSCPTPPVKVSPIPVKVSPIPVKVIPTKKPKPIRVFPSFKKYAPLRTLALEFL